MISPGASYTLEMVYDGSGQPNKTRGRLALPLPLLPALRRRACGRCGASTTCSRRGRSGRQGGPSKARARPARCRNHSGDGHPGPRPPADDAHAAGALAGLHSERQNQFTARPPRRPVRHRGTNVTANPGLPVLHPRHRAASAPPHPPTGFCPRRRQPGPVPGRRPAAPRRITGGTRSINEVSGEQE